MHQLAKEINLSETAFLQKKGDRYRLRWFTPGAEVKLCGHATLASAHVLYERFGLYMNRPIRFNTLSGELIARYKEGRIVLNFPSLPTTQIESPEGLLFPSSRGTILLATSTSSIPGCSTPNRWPNRASA